MKTIPGQREKVTLYFASEFTGRIIKREGRLVRIEDFTDPGRAHRGAEVFLIGKGGRSEQRIGSPFWILVDGWGHPDSLGGETSEMRHLAFDPAWTAEFMAGAGARLRPRYWLTDKTLRSSEGSGASAGGKTPADLEAEIRRVTLK